MRGILGRLPTEKPIEKKPIKLALKSLHLI